jgi:hypothetical protein
MKIDKRNNSDKLKSKGMFKKRKMFFFITKKTCRRKTEGFSPKGQKTFGFLTANFKVTLKKRNKILFP